MRKFGPFKYLFSYFLVVLIDSICLEKNSGMLCVIMWLEKSYNKGKQAHVSQFQE